MSRMTDHVVHEIERHGYVVFDYERVFGHTSSPESAARTMILNTLREAGYAWRDRRTRKVGHLVVGYTDPNGYAKFQAEHSRINGLDMRDHVTTRWSRSA